MACVASKVGLVRSLISQGIRATQEALSAACQEGRWDVVKIFLVYAQVDQREAIQRYGHRFELLMVILRSFPSRLPTLFEAAWRHANLKFVEFVLSHWLANIPDGNRKIDNNSEILHGINLKKGLMCAIESRRSSEDYSNEDIVKALLDDGRVGTVGDADFDTATFHHVVPVVQLFLDYPRLDPTVCVKKYTHRAIHMHQYPASNNAKLMKLLLEDRRADVVGKGDDYLRKAIDCSNGPAMDLLLTKVREGCFTMSDDLWDLTRKWGYGPSARGNGPEKVPVEGTSTSRNVCERI